MKMKLGCKELTYKPSDLMFAHFRDKSPLPPLPKKFGHSDLVTGGWGMFGNDVAGDCVFAGAAHETMLFNAMAGRKVNFTTAGVLSDYAAVTGYNPGTGANDNGTDPRAAMDYRRKTGIVDSIGVRHKIGAYLFLEPGNLTEIEEALYLFGAVGLCVNLPASAQDQFGRGKPWSVVANSPIDGGHYIPVVKKDSKFYVVTWEKEIEMTVSFLKKYCSAAIAILSPEIIGATGKTLEGFDMAQLQAVLAAL